MYLQDSLTVGTILHDDNDLTGPTWWVGVSGTLALKVIYSSCWVSKTFAFYQFSNLVYYPRVHCTLFPVTHHFCVRIGIHIFDSSIVTIVYYCHKLGNLHLSFCKDTQHLISVLKRHRCDGCFRQGNLFEQLHFF